MSTLLHEFTNHLDILKKLHTYINQHQPTFEDVQLDYAMTVTVNSLCLELWYLINLKLKIVEFVI